MDSVRMRNWLRNFWYRDTIDEMQRRMLRSARIRIALNRVRDRANRAPPSKRSHWVTA